MDEIIVQLEDRDVTGKAVKRLRDQGVVPAVIHDHGKASVIVQGNYVDIAKAYQKAGKHHPVSVKAGKKQYMALVKSVDFDPKKHLIRHVVFNAVKANEKVEAEIPVHIKFAEDNDSTPAERAGLVVLHQLEVVEVEAFPMSLPEALYFDGEKLIEVGDVATVADLLPVEGVIVKTDSAHPLATVFEPSALQAANDAAGGDAEEEAPGTEGGEETGETAAEAAADGGKEKE